MLKLGTEVLTALAPLRLVLTSARWLTYHVGLAVRAEIMAMYERLAARQGGPVTLASLWFEAMSVLHETAQPEVDRLTRELQARWADILDLPARPPPGAPAGGRPGRPGRAAVRRTRPGLAGGNVHQPRRDARRG